MSLLRTLKYRLRALTRKTRLDRDAEDEMRFHIEMLAKEHAANGLDKEEALRKARIEFGGMERMKENLRAARGVLLIENMARDTRLAFRQMRNAPGFTFVAIATLGIGIRACAAMFSIVNTVLLRPLPFEDPEELVWVQNYRQEGMSAQTTRVDNFLDWRDQNESFESMGAYFAFFDYGTILLANESGSGSERLRGVGISEGFLETLGVAPMLGRGFSPTEFQQPVDGSPKAVILDHRYWQRRFNGDLDAIGSVVTINGEPSEIIGVMPPSFDFDAVFAPGSETHMLTPFPLIEQTTNWGNTLAIVGRLKPGVSQTQAEAELRVITDRIRAENPNTSRFYHEANADMLDDRIRGSFKVAFYVLSAAVACVLLIACVNLSNLLIARANGRRKEFALRAAVGARRSHLVRQNLIESLVLAFGGCLVGLPLAYFATQGIAGLQAFSIPMLQMVEIDGTSILFVVVVATLSGIGCGLLPALQLSNRRPAEALGEDNQRGTAGRRAGWLRQGLVATEVALACLLLIGAGLLIRSFEKLVEVDLGFDPENAVAWRVDGDRSFSSGDERVEYYDAIAEHVASLPGVVATGLTDTLPLGRNRTWGIAAQDDDGQPGPNTGAFPRIVSYGYADAMGISVVNGRFFNEFDTGETAFSIVVNERLARTLWGDQSPVGKSVRVGRDEAVVVGVVDNVKHSSLDAEASNEMYFLMRQVGDFSAVEMVVRSRMPADLLIREVRASLRNFDASVPIDEYQSIQSIVDRSVAPQRLIMRVLSGFSVVALLLAAIGLYGVISYVVSQRSKEIGIRIAIGARQRTVMAMIVSEGFRVIVAGVAIGLLAAWGFSRYLSSLLYDVATNDPFVFAFNAALVAIIALAATVIPARQAMAVDPVQALRTS